MGVRICLFVLLAALVSARSLEEVSKSIEAQVLEASFLEVRTSVTTNSGTCAGNCGGSGSTGSCWCTPSCEDRVVPDCCDDYVAYCKVIDCEMTTWTEWGTCSVRCGGGVRQRTRSVTQNPNSRGEPCGQTEQSEACNPQPCPVPCEVSAWSDWSVCSSDCDGGEKQRTRNIVVPSAHGAAPCPKTTEVQTCNSNPCPVDCSMGSWGPWSECSVSCGLGVKSRSRTVNSPANFGGRACPATVETNECKIRDCPVNCILSEWSEWTTCTENCGKNGKQQRERSIVVDVSEGGEPCPVTKEEQVCNEKPCPIDCSLSKIEEEPYSDCSAPCGGGFKTRKVKKVIEEAYGGHECPPEDEWPSEQKECNTQKCGVTKAEQEARLVALKDRIYKLEMHARVASLENYVAHTPSDESLQALEEKIKALEAASGITTEAASGKEAASEGEVDMSASGTVTASLEKELAALEGEGTPKQAATDTSDILAELSSLASAI